MEVDQKLGMSLDDLIKNDKTTKDAVRQSRHRGRAPRPKKVAKTVKKDLKKKKGDSDAEMKDTGDRKDRRENRHSSKKQPMKVVLKKKTVVLSAKKEEKRKVKVTNIPYDVTWRDVKEAFAKTAPVERCDVEKGEATILFKNHSDAVKAINTYNGGNMNGRVIKAFFA
jgi:RNA recognition motif-containing protein